MKNSAILVNKENQQGNMRRAMTQRSHVSQQTVQQPYKPAIKIGYAKKDAQQLTTRRYKKPVMVVKNVSKSTIGLKKLLTNCQQVSSGIFVDSAYIPTNKNQPSEVFHKKRAAEAHQKYYGGKEITKQLKKQFSIKRSRSAFFCNQSTTKKSAQTSKISLIPSGGNREWDQNRSSINDILQYHYAGKYRQAKLASKCTEQRPQNRKYNYSQLHQYDYRKSKGQLR